MVPCLMSRESYLTDSLGTCMIYANTSYLYPVTAGSGSHGLEIPWSAYENLTLSRRWYKWYRQNIDENTGPMYTVPFLTILAYLNQRKSTITLTCILPSVAVSCMCLVLLLWRVPQRMRVARDSIFIFVKLNIM